MANQELLDQLNKRGWVHVKKVGPIFAKKLTEDTTINTLEGTERAKAGDMLCRGVIGELWPQKEERLLRNYRPTEVYDGEWRKYVPDHTQPGFFSVQVNHDFTVETPYGTMHGNKGDYLLKNFADKDEPYPAEVWVVAKRLFHRTYAKQFSPNEVSVALKFLS
jgi:hypothetical protein